MNINRNNYEEAFILYIDNELSNEDRTIVENFLRENNDLAKDLDILKQVVLNDEETVACDFKDHLLKTEVEINTNNYETYFLLDVDGELTGNQKGQVERFVLQHPTLQSAFTLLQQTKLEPDVIEFRDKSVLYKNPGKVISLNWWMKSAAAAAFIGLLASTYFLVSPGKNELMSKLSINQDAQVKQPVPPTNDLGNNTNLADAGGLNTTDNIKTHSKTRNVIKTYKQERNNTKPLSPSIVAANKISKRNFTSEQSQQNARIAQPGNTPIREYTDQDLANTITLNNSEKSDPIKSEMTALTQPNVATQIVYKEIDTQSAETDNSFLIGSASINKNKLRGLLKKASVLFDKKENRNDTQKKIQIASFEIKGK